MVYIYNFSKGLGIPGSELSVKSFEFRRDVLGFRVQARALRV
jgi:hypothetical protein